MIFKSKRHNFTLMETMVAGTILAFAVVSAMSILGNARANMKRGEDRWSRQHILSLAAEVYLLGGPNAEIPDGLLPAGYTSSCELNEVEDLPEDALESINGWQLCEYHIAVNDASGNLVAETRVRKVLQTEDLE